LGRASREALAVAVIFHITTNDEWREAEHHGRYEAPSLASAGFIHCSNGHQVVRVANHIFRGTTGLVLLHIDTEKLLSQVIYENLEGGLEPFPHVYGSINLDAVARITSFEPAEDGSFDHHDIDTDFS
jgi:uncharacterized protein (DUF952 family)